MFEAFKLGYAAGLGVIAAAITGLAVLGFWDWLGVKAFLPIPRSKSRKWQAAALAGEIRPTTEPDLDNCIKNLKDVCKGVFWQDDKQVVEYLPGTGKYYGDQARWEVEIETMDQAVSRRLL